MNARKVHTLIGLILAGTLLLDGLTPLGSQDFLLYVVPILLTAWLDRPNSAYVAAALTTGLVVVGAILSPPGIPMAVAIVNRGLTVVVFWITAFLVIRSRIVARERGAQHLAAIVRSSAEAILSQNLEGAVTSWNAAAERMLGYSAIEMVGRPIDRLLVSERREQDLGILRRIRQGTAIERHETTWCRKDGRLIDVLLSGSPLRDQAGATLGSSIIVYDMTPLKQALERVREQETRLNLVVSATQTGVWDWNLRTNGMYYSPYWKESLGYAPDDVMNSPAEWETRLHPDDRERAFALVRAFLAGEIPAYELEYRLRHRDGMYRWIHTKAVLMRDEQGAPIRMTGSHVDITERKRAEQALRQSEERFRRYFELGLIGMAMTSLDKHWIEFNDQLCTIFGYSRDELAQLTWADLTYPEDLDADVAQFQRVLDGEINGYSIEKRFIHKAGRLVHTVISGSAVRREDGSIDYFVVLVHDITERRRAEELLRQAHDLLERRVSERTGELVSATQRARTLAQRLYDVQEAERRQVAQDLHDEIGQALTALKLNLQQVEREHFGSAPGVELQESIGISDQLLGRVRSLALDLRPSLLDDLGLVPALRWYTTRQAERIGWDLHLDLPEGRPALTAPRSIACFRVVQEALTNVARHAGAKAVSVRLTVQEEQIRVVVQDDGCGFDIGAMRASAQQGRSMGLIGMEERISLVGGTLVVESLPRQGTKVDFSIPVVESQQEPLVR